MMSQNACWSLVAARKNDTCTRECKFPRRLALSRGPSVSASGTTGQDRRTSGRSNQLAIRMIQGMGSSGYGRAYALAWATARETADGRVSEEPASGHRISLYLAYTETDKLGQIDLVPNLLTEKYSEDGQAFKLVAALPSADSRVFANRLDQKMQEGVAAFPVNRAPDIAEEEGLREALAAVRKLRRNHRQRKRAALHHEGRRELEPVQKANLRFCGDGAFC